MNLSSCLQPGGFDLGVIAILLAAGVVVEPLVVAGLPSSFLRRREGDHTPALRVLAANYVGPGTHEPPHLQVHRPRQVIEPPVLLEIR